MKSESGDVSDFRLVKDLEITFPVDSDFNLKENIKVGKLFLKHFKLSHNH